MTTGDGSHTFISESYGVTYHSRFGAVTESTHVFINAGLLFKAAAQRNISVLEVGFGTGLNAFMTWIEAERHDLQVRYLTLEAYPLAPCEARDFNYPDALGVPERMKDLEKLHDAPWDTEIVLSDHFHLEKRLGRLEEITFPEAAFDLIYFDAFDPKTQPELWTEAIFAKLYSALRPAGVLVTYCAQGQFRRNLRSAGFSVKRLQGALGKFEMTRAVK